MRILIIMTNDEVEALADRGVNIHRLEYAVEARLGPPLPVPVHGHSHEIEVDVHCGVQVIVA